MQGVLTELSAFNLLTEDMDYRKLLFNVCHNSVFPFSPTSDTQLDSMNEVEAVELGDDEVKWQVKGTISKENSEANNNVANPSFDALFPTMTDFDKIFD